jgi:hypothetical protein
MSSPSTPTTTPIDWSVQQMALTGLSFPVARLEVRLHVGAAPPGPQAVPDLGWLDTGAPLSVVPFHIHSQGLVWQPLGIKTTWSGQLCELGCVDVWLPTLQPPNLRGPLSLLAKFPASDPAGDPVPILLGLEFLLAYQAQFHLLGPPQQGTLVLP